jgi:hypothetical protein
MVMVMMISLSVHGEMIAATKKAALFTFTGVERKWIISLIW